MALKQSMDMPPERCIMDERELTLEYEIDLPVQHRYGQHRAALGAMLQWFLCVV